MKHFFLICVVLLALLYAHGQTRVTKMQDTVPIKFDSLKAALVTATLRARIKGDTLEYNVANVVLRENSVIEELLRRLPGLRIDVNGDIFYNGEKIQHLLVDGVDIFGSAPTLVTRTFDASKIAKVQILDRKSDQAIFTGIDDGVRTKTLNLVLKEDAKNGYFGKIDAGGSLGGNYNADGALAFFRNKEQFTALGFVSNIGFVNSSESGGVSGFSFVNGNTDPLQTSAGAGIPRFEAVALHYANAWNGTASQLMTNYQFSDYYTNPISSTQTLQIQPNGLFGQYQQSESVNGQNQHWIYGTLELTPQSRSALRISFQGTHSQGQNRLLTTGNSSFNDTLVNSSQRSIRDEVNRDNLGGDATWRIRVGKQPGRIFSINAGMLSSKNLTNGWLYSLNRFYQPNGALKTGDTVDQRIRMSGHSLSVNSGFSYLQPVWKDASIGLGYILFYDEGDPNQELFNKGDGKYQDLIDTLSSHFHSRSILHYVYLTVQGRIRRLSYSIVNGWIDYRYFQQDLLADSTSHLRFPNFQPRAHFTYTPNATTDLSFSINLKSGRPEISQLQPIRTINNPLHVMIGNPNLRSWTEKIFQLDFRRIKTWTISLGAVLDLSGNNINIRTVTDSLGRQISQPVNVKGGKTATLNLSAGKKFGGFDVGFHGNANYSRTMNYVNSDLCQNDNYTFGGGFSLNKYVAEKYNLQVNTGLTYFDQTSSVNIGSPVHYWTQSSSGFLTLFLIRNYEINTNVNFFWQQKTNALGASTSPLFWNASISRNFLHDRLVAKFQFINILNQNSGISRNNVSNVNTETHTNILGRYWMVSVTYHFDKKLQSKQPTRIRSK